MGSETKGKRIDAGVGGLVWVRRRNGSWWPGRIMGLNELSESCLVSPRSGTPVKLLGREDASVDWYNLEKSKRVKAFRCGEYDECIEKAKAAAANSNRKTVKYARREDAILHALELENSLESSELHDSHPRTESAGHLKQNTLVRQPQNMSVSNKEHMHPNGKGCMFEANPVMEVSQSGISFEDPNHNNSSKAHSLQKNRRKTPNDSEDDGEGTKRMRDLDELGKGVASEKNAHSEGSHELVQLDSTSLSEPYCNSLASGSGINSSRNSYSFLKRKRSQVVNIHDNLKRKNRRRPLTKVLESTAMVSVPVFCDGSPNPGISSLNGVTESKVSALESTESKLTRSSAVMNNNSDTSGASYEKETSLDASEHTCDPDIDAALVHSESKDSEFSIKSEFPENDFSDGLFDVPFVVEEKQSEGFPPVLTSCTSKMLQSGAMGKRSGHLSQVGSVSLSIEGLDESGSASIAVDIINVSQRNEKGTSKWQSKRKRNSRNLNKKTRKSKSTDLRRRSIDRDAELEAFLAGWTQKVEINTCDDELHSLNDSANWSKQLSESNYSINYGRKSVRNGEAMTPSRRKAVKSATQFRKGFYLVEGAPISSRRPLPYRKSRFTSHSRYHDTDVYSENYLGVSSLFDVNLEVRASYRGQRVPLVSLMSKLNGKAIVGHPVTVEVWDDGYCDLLMSTINCCPTSNNSELYEFPTGNISDHSIDDTVLVGGHVKAIGNLKDGAGFPVKSHMDAPPRNPFKKSLKNKKYGLLSRRTRKLSSFNSRMEDKKPVVEKSEGPVIGCVPLKVVFTRINEGVNHATRMANCNLTRNE